MKPFRKRFVVVQNMPGQAVQVSNTGGMWQPYQLSPINPWQPVTTTNTNTGNVAPMVPTGTGGMYLPKTELPRREQDDPIVAYKRAKIVTDPFRLYGIGMNAAYKADDVAECKRAQTNRVFDIDDKVRHKAPHPGCTCGFYSMPKEWLGRLGGDYRDAVADIEVELFGKVIVHERGWRAERQRVLGVWCDPVCWQCHRQAEGMYRDVLRSPRGIGTYSYVRPMCTFCVKRHPNIGSKHKVTVGMLANEWKVEVRWGNIPF